MGLFNSKLLVYQREVIIAVRSAVLGLFGPYHLENDQSVAIAILVQKAITHAAYLRFQNNFSEHFLMFCDDFLQNKYSHVE